MGVVERRMEDKIRMKNKINMEDSQWMADTKREDSQRMVDTKREELLNRLAKYDPRDLEVALEAAEAHRRTHEEGPYFLHHFLGESRNFTLEMDGNQNDPVRVTIPLSELWMNGADMLHGGITALLCDNAMGMASYLQAQRPGVTVDLSVRYHKPVRGENVTATAEIVSAGSQLNSVRCVVHDDSGRIVASATGTFYHKQ